MLFATYQKIEIDTSDSERVSWSPESMFKNFSSNLPIYKNLPYIDEFGFPAIWCFPVLDFKSFIIHSMLTEPHFPMMFYVFESDDFKRIDKIQHYKQIKDDTFDGFKGIINDTLEDKYSEFIVNANTLTWNNCVCASVVSEDARAFSPRAMIFPYFLSHDREYIELSNKLSRLLMALKKLFPAELSCCASTDEVNSIRRDTRGNLQVQLNQKRDRFVQIGSFLVDKQSIAKARNIKYTFFEPFILPFLYENFLLDQQKRLPFGKIDHGKSQEIKVRLSTLMSVLCNFKEIYQYLNGFAVWAIEDCSYENYDSIYNNLERLIIDINDEEQLESCAYSVVPKLQQIINEREHEIANFNEYQRTSELIYDEYEYQRNAELALIEYDRQKQLLETKVKEKRRAKEKQVKAQKKKLRKKNKKN